MIHDFADRLAFSEGIEDSPNVMQAIAGMVPNCVEVIRASPEEDRHGTDYWIRRSHKLPPLSVDVKRRGFCPIERWGTDDACIETTSVYSGPNKAPWLDIHRSKPGWTLDYRKRTDFVVYTWPTAKGTRFWIVPFAPLCTAARVNWRAWATQYAEHPAYNRGYLTLCIYPPRSVIARAIRAFMSGVA